MSTTARGERAMAAEERTPEEEKQGGGVGVERVSKRGSER